MTINTLALDAKRPEIIVPVTLLVVTIDAGASLETDASPMQCNGNAGVLKQHHKDKSENE